MTTNWPGAAVLPALASRAGYARKSLQLPFATGATPTESDAPELIWGTGSPEGVVVGAVGDIYIQTDGTNGATLWKKRSGSAGTGWQVFELDQKIQSIAYAATITPDALAGGIVDVGALTGALLVNAPLNPVAGLRLAFRFLEDGTGGRAVSWDAVFLHNWTNAGNGPGARGSVSFAYDGASWVQVGAQRLWKAAAPLDTAGDLAQTDVLGGFRQTIDGWYQENVAASQTDVALTRLATTTEAPTRWIAVRAGSITGVNVKSNAARSAGTLTIKVFKNGVVIGTLTAVLDGTNTTFKATTQAKDTDLFVAGDELELRVTTDAGWLPVTADIRASLEVET